MSEFQSLFDRCASAVGPDRDLDHAIRRVMSKAPAVVPLAYLRLGADADTTPAYTRSLSAASSLVEAHVPSGFWSVSRHAGLSKRKRKNEAKTKTPYEAYVANHDRIGEPGYVFSLSDPTPSPALALCCAFLGLLVAAEKLAKT